MTFTKLPRFQFFHDLGILLTGFSTLFFSDKNSTGKTTMFLSSMKDYFGRKDAHLVSSFRMGLFQTLRALDLRPGDEVLLTPITVADSVNAIRLCGLRPVLVDMDLDTHAICLSDLEKKIGPRSKVVVATYLSGIVPDVDSIRKLARSHNLILIEDISQNMGATLKGQKVGSHGDVSIASLSCGKNISTLYGGLILSDNLELMDTIRNFCSLEKAVPQKSVLAYYLLNSIKVQIATSRVIFSLLVYPILKLLSALKKSYPVDFDHDPVLKNNIFSSSKPTARSSWPAMFFIPVNDWQIGLTTHQLKKIDEGTRKRRRLAEGLLENLSKDALSRVPKGLLNTSENSYYHFPVFCDGKRAQMRKYLFSQGIDNGFYGLNLCSEETAFDLRCAVPGASKIKHDSLFLPIHEDFSEDRMLHIARSVNEYFALFR